MEVHLVHWNKKYRTYSKAAEKEDGLAVVAFFIEVMGDVLGHYIYKPLGG